MVLESIQKTGVTYQGSTSQTENTQETAEKADVKSEEVTTAEQPQVNGETVRTEVNPFAEAAALNAEEKTAPIVGNEAMKKAVEEINKNAKNSEAIFGIHEATNRVTIKIVDKDSKKVIKEYPPEKTLDMIAKAWEMAGLMVDEKR